MPRLPKSIEDDFFAGRRSDLVPFVINDAVEVVYGLHTGRRGAVISIDAVEPELRLRVELDDGFDVQLVAKQIRLMDDAG